MDFSLLCHLTVAREVYFSITLTFYILRDTSVQCLWEYRFGATLVSYKEVKMLIILFGNSYRTFCELKQQFSCMNAVSAQIGAMY
jgi:hypothetical protein